MRARGRLTLTRRPSVCGLALMLGLLAGGVSRPAAAQDLGPVIDSSFAELARTDAPGCAVGVQHQGRQWLRAYGMSNLEYGVPLTPESVLETGSVAKQFTAAALVLLAQDGKLSLDDDVRKYLPEVPDFGATITLRHLLNHTSGLRDQWALYSIVGTPPGTMVHTIPGILHLVSRQRMLNFPPGTEYLYSNTGWTLLTVVVSRVAGQAFAEFSEERLFGPLGMTSTAWRDDFRTIVPDRATAYEPSGQRWLLDMPFTMVHGNGGLLTTVGDMLIWNEALDQGTVPGGAALVRELETQGVLNDGTVIDYALGVSVGEYRGTRMVSHGGSTAGYRTWLARFPERDLSLAVFCNAANANPARHARRIADVVLGTAEPAPPTAPVAIAAEALAELAGVYRDSTSDQFLTIGIQEGRLMAGGGGQPTGLTHLGGHRFWSATAGDYRFLREGASWAIREHASGPRVYRRLAPVTDSLVPTPDYPGVYRNDELDVTIEVRADRGRLLLIRPPGTLPALSPIYPDGFRAGGFTVRFQRDAAGRVVGLRIFAGRARDVRFVRQP